MHKLSQNVQAFAKKRTNSKDGAQSAIKINFKAQNRKTKTDTNPILDPKRYMRRCPDPNATLQKFYTLYRNTTKEFTQSYYKKLFAEVSRSGWAKSTIKLFDK